MFRFHWPTVHPHVRGEHSRCDRDGRAGSRFIPTCVGNTDQQGPKDQRKCGSSPRAWGTLVGGPFGLVLDRFIPTCVGNTSARRFSVRARPGSSPRAWGTLFQVTKVRSCSPVHPHVRGEHASYPLSPPMATRFIPTCVGNTATSLALLARRVGSSPRAWGTLRESGRTTEATSVHPHVRGEHGTTYALQDVVSRFIPTCVGNTRSISFSLLPDSGSSPRAWGTRDPQIRTCCLCTVHPHVRGEHVSTPEILCIELRFIPTCVGNTNIRDNRIGSLSGSSPRAWGTHLKQMCILIGSIL